jgi:predicted metalloendopeptidase
LTHGFDPQGRFYNGSGYLINWWQPQTAEAFQQRADCIIAQYSTFEVLPGLYINGNQTQGENVADCGGIKNAYNAYIKVHRANISVLCRRRILADIDLRSMRARRRIRPASCLV